VSQPADGPAEITESLADDCNVTIPGDGDEPSRDYTDLVATVAGVNGVVRGLPVAQLTGDDVEDWPPQVVLGATMLVKRFWRRRDTPAGVNLATDDGAVIAFARSDPDAAMLLQLGAYEKPNRVG
jgi:hypothetical protein